MIKNYCLINGKSFKISGSENYLDKIIIEFLGKMKMKKSIAVAVNDELILRSDWDRKIIAKGDKIEIVNPFFGG
ncbi:MAG: sulfur carrier protein ThiS [Alphaproteobacteria bacterium]